MNRKFTGDKSRSEIRKKVFEFLNSLEYETLSRTQKEKLRESGIKDEEEFNEKKSTLKRYSSIIYLDSGKNLFWVKGRYGAAHYGRIRKRVYVSAGYATRASPDQIYEVVAHDILHILGFTHQQALNVAKKHNISYRAQELMDELAKENNLPLLRDPAVSKAKAENAVRDAFRFGQGHIFDYWSELSGEGKEELLRYVKRINFEKVDKLYSGHVLAKETGKKEKEREIIPE